MAAIRHLIAKNLLLILQGHKPQDQLIVIRAILANRRRLAISEKSREGLKHLQPFLDLVEKVKTPEELKKVLMKLINNSKPMLNAEGSPKLQETQSMRQ